MNQRKSYYEDPVLYIAVFMQKFLPFSRKSAYRFLLDIIKYRPRELNGIFLQHILFKWDIFIYIINRSQ